MTKSNVYLVIASGYEEEHVMGVLTSLGDARRWMNKLEFHRGIMRDIENDVDDAMKAWKTKNPVPPRFRSDDMELMDRELAAWDTFRAHERSEEKKRKRAMTKKHFGDSWKEFAKIPYYRFAPNYEILRIPLVEGMPKGFPFKRREVT